MGRGALAVGIVYETFETYARRASEPDDAQAEYEPESTIAVLAAAVPRLGRRPLRLGSLHEVLVRLASGLSSGGGLGTPIERGVELFKGLPGRTSGFAIPQNMLDTPFGKVPLDHPWARGREADDFVAEAWTGDVRKEPNPR